MNADFFSWERFADVFPKVLVKLPVTFEIVLMATVIGLCLGTILAMIRIKNTGAESDCISDDLFFQRDAGTGTDVYCVLWNSTFVQKCVWN